MARSVAKLLLALVLLSPLSATAAPLTLTLPGIDGLSVSLDLGSLTRLLTVGVDTRTTPRNSLFAEPPRSARPMLRSRAISRIAGIEALDLPPSTRRGQPGDLAAGLPGATGSGVGAGRSLQTAGGFDRTLAGLGGTAPAALPGIDGLPIR